MMQWAKWGRGYKAVRHRWSDPLSQMDPLEFERLMGRYFEEQGYRVEHVGTGGRATRYDGGIDLMLYRGDERIVVQCKRWTAYQVPHTDVHQLLGIIRTESATGGIFISSGEFTRAATEKMRGIPEIRLVDGHELRSMLGPLLDSIPSSAVTVAAGREFSKSTSRSTASGIRDLPPFAPDKRLSRAMGRRRDRDWGPLMFGAAVLLVLMVSCVRFVTKPDDTVRTPARQVMPTRAEPAPLPRRQAQPSQPVMIRTEAPELHKQTPEEAREAKRRADAAMEVIRKTTPEM